MLIVFAIILTSITIICGPILYWTIFKHSHSDDFTFFGGGDTEATTPIAIFGWLFAASFLFALILWVIYGITEYRTPIPKFSESLSSLEIILQETETAIDRLKGQAVEAEESAKKYENLSAKTASELDSLQSALALVKKNQGEIRKILIGPHWGDRFWSFILGVFSSLIATFLWMFFYHYRKTKTKQTRKYNG